MCMYDYTIVNKKHPTETQQHQDKRGKKIMDQNSPQFLDYISRYEDTGVDCCWF